LPQIAEPLLDHANDPCQEKGLPRSVIPSTTALAASQASRMGKTGGKPLASLGPAQTPAKDQDY
jgi:hypothetical protein